MLISTATSVIPDHISVQPCQKIGNFGSSWTTVWPFTPFGLLCDWEFRMLNTCIVSSSQIFWEDGHGMRSAWSMGPWAIKLTLKSSHWTFKYPMKYYNGNWAQHHYTLIKHCEQCNQAAKSRHWFQASRWANQSGAEKDKWVSDIKSQLLAQQRPDGREQRTQNKKE